MVDLRGSKKHAEEAEQDHRLAVQNLLAAYAPVEKRAERYARQQLRAHREVVEPMVSWLTEHGSDFPQTQLGRVEPGNPRVTRMHSPEAGLDLGELAAGGIAAVTAAAGVPAAALGMATLFGTASTGASIGSLGGIAATNAAYAWLGGGAIAAGGGGIAGGQMLINLAVPGVGVAVAGLSVLVVGERAKTKADKYCARVRESILEMQARERFAPTVVAQIEQVSRILAEVSRLARQAQRELFALPSLDVQRDADLVQRAVMLTVAMATILATPILNSDGMGFHEALADALTDATRACNEGGL
jgi:hypothetical protein